MSLSIRNNLMSNVAQKNFGDTYEKMSSSVNSLSSGLRINDASDDAAGLAIREDMRAEIGALDQGVRNANDGVSMLQTYDGAAQVVDNKLVRMKELAEQSATGTYDDDQRDIMQDEFKQLSEEIDRIAETTDFNGISGISGG
ncbi:MAG: flagellin, partial [Candidatus Brocadiia bacterium]